MSLPPEPEQANVVIGTIRTAAEYWDLIHRIVPVAVVGGATAVIVNLVHIAREQTWICRIFMCLQVVGIGCVAAGASVLGLSFFVETPTMETQLLAASISGSSGQKIFEIYGRRLFGLQNTRGNDPPTRPTPLRDRSGEDDDRIHPH
jgi:hypothetical protein